MTVGRLEKPSEQLIQSADDEHRGIVVCQRVEAIADREQIGLDQALAGILTATADDEVDICWELLAWMMLDELCFVLCRIVWTLPQSP